LLNKVVTKARQNRHLLSAHRFTKVGARTDAEVSRLDLKTGETRK
jgi:hypothetical protein